MGVQRRAATLARRKLWLGPSLVAIEVVMENAFEEAFYEAIEEAFVRRRGAWAAGSLLKQNPV